MTLLDIVNRTPTPAPWAEGDKIPWDEPGFSARMLREHLSQDHDAASRRAETIDAHVAWIHGELLGARPTRVLDLGCGPGLYSHRLARLGHACVGLDFSPASIAYAQEHAAGLPCTFRHEDIRTADYGAGFGLVMQIFGEINVFTPADLGRLLDKAAAALAPGGLLLLEPHTFEAVARLGRAASTWYTAREGLFSPDPHLCLQENSWDLQTRTASARYYVLDAATGQVARHAQTMQAYDDAAYRAMLSDHGFGEIRFLPSLRGKEDASSASMGLFAITAEML